MAYYFRYGEEELPCYPLHYWKDVAESDEEIIYLRKAQIIYGEDFFWCSHYGEPGLVGEGCGNECKDYNPRNGKSGRCKHSKNCYEAVGDKLMIHPNRLKLEKCIS